jgi:2-isopropylmalate synthase
MKPMNYRRYTPYAPIELEKRRWPDARITRAPLWCSVDLRDGNQALSIPMSVDEKIEMFELLTAVGFKEIEVGFPSASETEFRFVRRLIEEGRIPGDVTIQVLTQAREHLIRRTIESIRGAKQAIVHLYNSTSTLQREVVFRMGREEIKEIAVQGTRWVKSLRGEAGDCDMRFEYSPESFVGTELDYALDVCHAVMDVWEPSPGRKIILNLPSTVEMSTPNLFADRIEWFCGHLRNRESATISVHTHNDRGTAVASAELAVMAGADRVEGALFGNGERSGNMDLVTMALNLFSQGVDPGLDLSDINRVIDTYTKCTRMEVPPRHPYAGELVYTAFSGSHQDAISKGMKAQAEQSKGLWEVPYLPIDPTDVGRTYEAIIRINSQAGKGGIAYVMEKEYGIQIPKWMQPHFGAVVQAVADRTGDELGSELIHGLFENEYLQAGGPCRLKKCSIDSENGDQNGGKALHARVVSSVQWNGKSFEIDEHGNGPVDAFVKGLRKGTGMDFSLEKYSEHAIGQGEDALAASYIMIRDKDRRASFGAGIDSNIALASLKAVLSAVNRLLSEKRSSSR